jgi:hypothetical protein
VAGPPQSTGCKRRNASRYCAYLVALAGSLLPGQQHDPATEHAPIALPDDANHM